MADDETPFVPRTPWERQNGRPEPPPTPEDFENRNAQPVTITPISDNGERGTSITYENVQSPEVLAINDEPVSEEASQKLYEARVREQNNEFRRRVLRGEVPVSPGFAEKAGLIDEDERRRAESQNTIYFVRKDKETDVDIPQDIEQSRGVSREQAENLLGKASLGERFLLGASTIFSGRGIDYLGAGATALFSKQGKEKAKDILVERIQEAGEKSRSQFVKESVIGSVTGSPTGLIGTSIVVGAGITKGLQLTKALPVIGKSLNTLATGGLIGAGGVVLTERGIKSYSAVRQGDYSTATAEAFRTGIEIGGGIIGARELKPEGYKISQPIGVRQSIGIRNTPNEIKLVKITEPLTREYMTKEKPKILIAEGTDIGIVKQLKIVEGGKASKVVGVASGSYEFGKGITINEKKVFGGRITGIKTGDSSFAIQKTTLKYLATEKSPEIEQMKEFEPVRLFRKPSRKTPLDFPEYQRPKAVSASAGARADLLNVGKIKTGTMFKYPEIIKIRGLPQPRIKELRSGQTGGLSGDILADKIRGVQTPWGFVPKLEPIPRGIEIVGNFRGLGIRNIPKTNRKPKLSTGLSPKQNQTPFSGLGQIPFIGTVLKQTPELIPKQKPKLFPRLIPKSSISPRYIPPRISYGFRLPKFKIPPLKLGTDMGRLAGKRKLFYTPSIGGIGLGLKALKIPKSSTYGLSPRPILALRKHKRKVNKIKKKKR